MFPSIWDSLKEEIIRLVFLAGGFLKGIVIIAFSWVLIIYCFEYIINNKEVLDSLEMFFVGYVNN